MKRVNWTQPIQTGAGEDAVLLKTLNHGDYPRIVIITDGLEREHMVSTTDDGEVLGGCCMGDDIENKVQAVWVNVYENETGGFGFAHKSRESADKAAGHRIGRIACKKVTFVPGDVLEGANKTPAPFRFDLANPWGFCLQQ